MRKAKVSKAKNKFATLVDSILGFEVDDDTLEVTWTTGGMSGGSCWHDRGADQAVDGETEPEFNDLDKILEELVPTMAFLSYKRLLQEVVERDSRTESEYYGNYYTKGIKRVSISKLENYLKEKNLWQE